MKQFTYWSDMCRYIRIYRMFGRIRPENRYNVNTFIAGYPGKNDNCVYSRNRDIKDNMVVGSFRGNAEKHSAQI